MSSSFPLLRSCFGALVALAIVHTSCSWALLLALRKDQAARIDLFGSVKTIVFGPKTIRLKHIFSQSLPQALELHSAFIRSIYSLAKWSGWSAAAMTLVVAALQVQVWLALLR